MDNIDFEIRRLETLRTFLKLEINSNYGTSPAMDIQKLFEERNEITQQLKNLHLVKKRNVKINKIKQRNEKGMEV